jgi:hypothetical protein
MTSVRSQTERDLQTVTIAMSLAIFVGTLVVGGLIDVIGDPTGRASTVLQVGTLALATMLGLAYLVRHR